MENITLIHPFEVSKDDEKEFLLIWKNIDKYMRRQKGFISTKLHKSLDNALPNKILFITLSMLRNGNQFQIFKRQLVQINSKTYLKILCHFQGSQVYMK